MLSCSTLLKSTCVFANLLLLAGCCLTPKPPTDPETAALPPINTPVAVANRIATALLIRSPLRPGGRPAPVRIHLTAESDAPDAPTDGSLAAVADALRDRLARERHLTVLRKVEQRPDLRLVLSQQPATGDVVAALRKPGDPSDVWQRSFPIASPADREVVRHSASELVAGP